MKLQNTKCRQKECPAWRPCGCFQNLEDICKMKNKTKEEAARMRSYNTTIQNED